MSFELYQECRDQLSQAFWRERCTRAWVAILYEVSSVRASNWHFWDRGTIYVNRYDNADAFHRSKAVAEHQVESKRAKGAGWRITEWPCLVVGNSRGCVALVQINTHRPFDGWDLDYGRKVSLGAIAETWATEAARRRTVSHVGYGYPAYTHMFIHSADLADFECGCGKYRHRRFKGIICERCGVEVSPRPVDRKGRGQPVLRNLTTACKSWRSESVGGDWLLHWHETSAGGLDVEPAYRQVGKLLTHLSS